MANEAKKGSAYERRISKALSLWWSEEKRDDIFWRTATSGGRATSRTKKGKKTAFQYGDITFTDPIGKPLIDNILIEVKRGYSIDRKIKVDILDFIDKKKNKEKILLLQFWTKAEEERKIAKRKGTWIILERDARSSLLIMANWLFAKFEYYCGKFDNDAIIIDYGWTKGQDEGGLALILIRLDDFFAWVTPEMFDRFRSVFLGNHKQQQKEKEKIMVKKKEIKESTAIADGFEEMIDVLDEADNDVVKFEEKGVMKSGTLLRGRLMIVIKQAKALRIAIQEVKTAAKATKSGKKDKTAKKAKGKGDAAPATSNGKKKSKKKSKK